MDLFGVQFLQAIAVLSVASVLLGAAGMMPLFGNVSTGPSPAARLMLQRLSALAYAKAGQLRPFDVLLSNLPARAPPLIPPRPSPHPRGAPRARE